MRLILNGRDQEIPDCATLADLARWLDLPAFGSAVELNGVVVPKAAHDRQPLAEGDRVEVVRLVGGG